MSFVDCKFFAVLFAFIQLLLPTQSAFAVAMQQRPEHKDNYYLETTLGHPHLWFPRDMPIKVIIRPAPGVQNYQPYQAEVFKECLKRYETISNGKIKFVVVDRFPYDITCTFSYKLPVGATDSDAGWTTVATSPYHIDQANITILTRNKKWLEKETLREICMHEIGHALGMHNHSPDPHDVMYPACTVVPQKLSMRDANTLGIIYNFKPSDAILAKLHTYSGKLTSVKPISLSREQAQSYCDLLSRRLRAVTSSTAESVQSCDILLLLDADGCIYNYRITRRSDSIAFDQSVLSALVTSIPLPKPPDGILTSTPETVERLLLAFTCSSDGKIVPAQPPVDATGEYVPCAEAGPAQPLYEQEKASAASKNGGITEAAKSSGSNGAMKTGGSGTSKPDEAQWAAQVAKLAKANFQQASGGIVLSMGIKPDGSVAHLNVKQSTANAFVEKAAIDSCILAEPYPKPPGNGDFVRELEISFD